MKVPFTNWVFGAILVLIIILGSFSGVNDYGAGSFPAAVAMGWREQNILLILTAILSAVLFLWLLLLFLSFAWQWAVNKWGRNKASA